MSEPQSEVQAVHDLINYLNAEGYTVGLDTDEINDKFHDRIDTGKDLLDAEDLGAYFVVAHRDGQTDYASDVVVQNEVAFGIVQIEMLGAHFRTVLDALPLDASDLVDAVVDEAVKIDPVDDV